KMVQNVLIGAIAFGVATYWVARVDRTPGAPRPSLWELWRRFPKFVLGFVALSLLGTWISAGYESDGGAAVVDGAIQSVTKTIMGWCFCLGFVSIGLDTNFRTLAKYFKGGKPLVLY